MTTDNPAARARAVPPPERPNGASRAGVEATWAGGQKPMVRAEISPRLSHAKLIRIVSNK